MNYYVASSGSDSTGTGTALNPWKTLDHAVATVPDETPTIYRAAGTYPALTLTRQFVTRCTIIDEGETFTEGESKLEGVHHLVFKGAGAKHANPKTGLVIGEDKTRFQCLRILTGNIGVYFIEVLCETGGYGFEGEPAFGAALKVESRNKWTWFIRCHIANSWGAFAAGHQSNNIDSNRSRYLHFYECLFEHVTGDLNSFGSLEDAIWRHCIIRGCAYRNNTNNPHPDHLQFTGDVYRALVDSCWVYQLYDPTNTEIPGDLTTQMLFCQAELGGISEVKVVNSLFASLLSPETPGVISCKVEGATKLELLYNTFWTPNYTGTVELNGASHGKATDSIIVGNVIGGKYAESSGSSAAVRDYNAYSVTPAVGLNAHEIKTASMGFVDLSEGYEGYNNYELESGSPLKEAGETTYAPKVDILGRPRGSKPSIGCYQ